MKRAVARALVVSTVATGLCLPSDRHEAEPFICTRESISEPSVRSWSAIQHLGKAVLDLAKAHPRQTYQFPDFAFQGSGGIRVPLTRDTRMDMQAGVAHGEIRSVEAGVRDRNLKLLFGVSASCQMRTDGSVIYRIVCLDSSDTQNEALMHDSQGWQDPGEPALGYLNAVGAMVNNATGILAGQAAKPIQSPCKT